MPKLGKHSKRTLLAALLAAFLAWGALRPAPARADATPFIVAGAATAAWFLIVIGATYYVYGRKAPPSAFASLPLPEPEERTVRVGRDCAPLTGNPFSVCW
ncbi:MAG: hypothetical protein KatS3mg076_1474 [Candidatus Binatia bacterium]|nr:MAG: hypothetical protein KatS3mg076_1474 [Candidatus Binatia bacterium]